MTLYRQLMTLFVFFVLIIVASVSYINFKLAINLVDDRMVVLFDTNTILLEDALSQNDDKLIEKKIDEALKNAYCNKIELFDENNNLVYSASNISPNPPAPSWFLSFVENIGFKKLISSEFSNKIQTGSIKYSANLDYIYSRLYTSFKNILVATLIVALLGAFVFYVFLRSILKPLKLVQEQAKAILANEFKLQDIIPNTLDIKEVVMAMNKVVNQAKELFERESETFLKYQALIYKDNESGLYNRRYFLTKIDEYLKDEAYSFGACNLIMIDNANKIKHILGYEKYISLVLSISNLLSKNKIGDNIILCRINELEFIYISPREKASFIKEITEDTLSRINDILNNFNIKENVNSAIVSYDSSFNSSLLLSCLDNTILMAKNEGNLCIKIYEKGNKVLSRNDYKEIILRSIKKDLFGFNAGEVIGEVGHYELFLRLINEDGTTQPASCFIPMVSEFGIDDVLDNYVLNLVLKSLKNKKFPEVDLAINISKGLINYENFSILENLLQKIAVSKYQKIYFEISDHCQIDIIILEHFVSLLRKYGFGFGIDYFMFEESSLDKLNKLKPDYIKTRANYLKELLSGEHKMVFKRAFDVVISTKNTKVIATCIESQDLKLSLESLGILSFQGSFISKEIKML